MHNLWTRFSLAWIYCLRLDGFYSFFSNNNGIFSGVILSDFQAVLCVGVVFHGTDSPFRRVPCVMSLESPYDPLTSRLN